MHAFQSRLGHLLAHLMDSSLVLLWHVFGQMHPRTVTNTCILAFSLLV